ncbi:MAG: hypothetical protein Q7U24_14320, partial [Sulfurimicrobium sp.]|nr:hypothetical protein [Sulfurimicrobium sp.]
MHLDAEQVVAHARIEGHLAGAGVARVGGGGRTPQGQGERRIAVRRVDRRVGGIDTRRAPFHLQHGACAGAGIGPVQAGVKQIAIFEREHRALPYVG